MFRILENFVNDFKGLLFAVVGVLILLSVIQTWARTRSLAPTIGVVVIGGVVLWGLASVSFIQDEVTEDVRDNNPNGSGGNNDPCGRPDLCRVVVDLSDGHA